MKKNFGFYIIMVSAFVWAGFLILSANNLIEASMSLDGSTIDSHRENGNAGRSESFDVNSRSGNLFQTNTYERIYKEVVQLGRTKNLKGLEELEKYTNSSALKENIPLYTDLMITICGAYNTYDFKDSRQYVLARRCAKHALKRLDDMPIGRATNLVAQLGGDTEYLFQVVPESNWQKDRTERAEYWFRAWQLLDRAILKDYNFSANRPIYHAKMSVMERAKAEEYNAQRFLRRDRDNFQVEFRRFIVDAYSRPPVNLSELRDFLAYYVSDPNLRSAISSEVEERILLFRKNK